MDSELSSYGGEAKHTPGDFVSDKRNKGKTDIKKTEHANEKCPGALVRNV